MMQVYKTLATGFGIGYVGKGGGSIAAAVCAAVWYLAFAPQPNLITASVLVIGVTTIGIWTSSAVEADWGKDNQKVVIDEIAGMAITLMFIPVTIPYVLIGFVLFRFFDIVKPLYIRKLENLPGGWGVMLDDVLAGIYANILLQVVVYLQWF